MKGRRQKEMKHDRWRENEKEKKSLSIMHCLKTGDSMNEETMIFPLNMDGRMLSGKQMKKADERKQMRENRGKTIEWKKKKEKGGGDKGQVK